MFCHVDGLESYGEYYLPNVEIKDYINVMIYGWNFFDQPIKNEWKYDNIRKIATGQRDDYTTRCLPDYPYFQNYYKVIAIDLSKQQKLDADSKVIQQINFTGNLDRTDRTVLEFSKVTVKVLWFYFVLIKY